MKKYILIIAIFILAVSLLFDNGHIQEVEWNEFIWAGSTIGEEYYDKAALLIPFRFKDIEEEYYLQLDTGASSVLYGNSFYDIDPSYRVKKQKYQRPSIVSIDGDLANYEFEYQYFGLLQDYGNTMKELKENEYKLIGSLGLDFFKNKILIINFPEEKFTILNNRKSIPKDIKENSYFLNMKYKNNKIYLMSKIGGKDLSLFYDTGASIFDIVTTKETWTSLTNLKDSNDIKLLEIPSWGDIIQLKGTRSENDWKIGDISIEKPLVFYEPSGLENFNFKLIQADGLLGNAIFYDNHIISIDLINKKFGIMEAGP